MEFDFTRRLCYNESKTFYIKQTRQRYVLQNCFAPELTNKPEGMFVSNKIIYCFKIKTFEPVSSTAISHLSIG